MRFTCLVFTHFTFPGFSLWANLDRKFADHLSELAKGAKIDDSFINDLAQVWEMF
jgi:hypothetical protein